MAARITFNGLKETHNFMIKLPKRLDDELSKTNKDFIDEIAALAIELAPEDTGELKESIKVLPVQKTAKNVKKWKVVVNAPHGIYQEEGFTPHFAFITRSKKYPNNVPKKWLVKKWTPFMRPAFERVESKYLNMLKVSTNRALAK